MALENEYMLEELTAEEIYQKKLTAGANITIDNQNVISSTGGGSSVQYTSNYAQGDILGTLNIDGASSAIRTPNLVEGENITITRNQQAGTVTISSSAGSGDLSAHELTEEAYNNLTPAEKTNGELYLTHPATVGSSDPNKIYYNDTLYGTEGGNDVVELTQAEWDALPSSKLTDGIIYVITDGGSGGGGAISDLTDVELTNLADGEILKYDATAEKWINAVESGGGSEAVYKTLAEYEALPTADKEDPTKIYFVKDTGTTVSETKTQDDGTVTASAVDGTHYAWYVFDAQGNNRYWSPSNTSFSGSWFKYEFVNKYTFTDMDIWLSTWDPRLVRVVIEASNDNSNWTNITQNEYYDIETDKSGWNTTGTKYSFILSANTIYKYVRVTFSLSPASQTTQGETALYVQHCDIKAATDVRPKIYYKNVLYTPDELPTVSTSDTGKALVVNSDGAWDKSDIPRTNSVQIPPVIFDNGELKKINDMTGFPELEKVFITAEEYSQLTTAQKQDLTKIYYVSPYEFYTLKDGEITIRVNGTTYEWFFNGFILTDDYYEIPSEYRQYTKNTPYQGSTAWSDNTSLTSLGTIEMGPSGYTERISAQDGNWGGSYIKNTPMYGKIVTGGGSSQTNTYSSPYDVETPIEIYYGNKQYTDFDPLPSVTSADNGKVLKVVSGEWDKGDIREVPVIDLGDNDKILTVESGEASWSSPKKVTHLYDEIPVSNPLYFLGNIDPSTSPLTIDMTQIATNYEELRSTDFEFVFMGGESNLINRPWGYNPIDSAPGTFSYTPSTGELIATLYGGFNSVTNIGMVYKKAIIQLNENAVITGQSGTIDCSDIPSADVLTVDNFAIVLTNVNEPNTSNPGALQIAASMSYNQTTKQLSWSVNATSWEHLQASGYVIVGNYGDPEYRLITNFTGATSSSDGYRGYVPAPLAGDENKVLKGDGTWGENANRLILDAQIYSEDEKQVGVWIDNKPLYQITYDAGSNIDVKYNSWTNITINELKGSENIVMGYGTNSGGTYTPLQVSWTGSVGSKIIQVQTPRNSNNQGVRYFTILYTKSADSAGSGGYQAYGFSPIIYSEEEREVGVWIDNKPLYAKSFHQQLTPNSANIDVSDLNIENGWVYDGFYDIGVTNLGLNEMLSSNSYTWTHLNNELSPPYIDCFCAGFNNSTVYVTILYTKTTDVAGSGSYNTLGVPTVHYSTDEQVIGTWTDGRPIYQKIITYDSTINSNAWTTIDNSITTAIVDHFFVDNIDWQYSSYIVGGANTGGGGLSTTLTANGLSLENQTPVAGSNFTLIVKYTKIADIQSS